jgi:hypothetical protein
MSIVCAWRSMPVLRGVTRNASASALSSQRLPLCVGLAMCLLYGACGDGEAAESSANDVSPSTPAPTTMGGSPAMPSGQAGAGTSPPAATGGRSGSASTMVPAVNAGRSAPVAPVVDIPSAGTGGIPTAGSMSAAAGAMATSPASPGSGAEPPYHDPGTGPWEMGTPEECKMDTSMIGGGQNLAVFRYGKLCHVSGGNTSGQNWSVTKSLGGVLAGRAAYLVKDVPRMGPGTGIGVSSSTMQLSAAPASRVGIDRLGSGVVWNRTHRACQQRP